MFGIRTLIVAGGMAVALTTTAHAVVLDSTLQCSAGNAINGIVVGDVTGNKGGATDCWGTFAGNDPGPSGGGFEIDGMQFDFVAKQNATPVKPGDPIYEGDDIGLKFTPAGGALSGDWSFDSSLFAPQAFLIVLKAANDPGFGTWLFEGWPDATSSFGTWSVAWGNNLSHFAIYAKDGSPPVPPNAVPEPSTIGMLGLALLGTGMAGIRRRRRS